MFKKVLFIATICLSLFVTTLFQNGVYATSTNTTISSTETEKIQHVDLQGIQYPVVGEKPDNSATTSTKDVAVSNVSWNMSGSFFEYNKTYSITLELTANNGKEFADQVTVSLWNDSDFTVEKVNNITLKVTKTFQVIFAPDIYMEQSDTTLAVQETLALSVYDKTGSKLTWSSSDPNIVSVDENGLVTAITSGSAIITATNAYQKQASITITVEAKNDTITQNPIPSTIQEVTLGNIALPVVKETPQENIEVNTPDVVVSKVQWTPVTTTFDYEQEYTVTVELKSMNNKVFDDSVTVNRGLYQVEKIDDTTISVSKTFKKIDAPTISIAQSDTTLYVNESLQLTLLDVTNSKVTWSSSHSDIVFVDENGLIQAKKEGEAIITAENVYGKQASIKIKVMSKDETTSPIIVLTHIPEVKLGDIEAPIIGKSPKYDTELYTDSVELVDIEWSPVSNAFTYDTEYKVMLTLRAKEGYMFDMTSSVKVGDITYHVEKVEDSLLIASYTFPKTPKVLTEPIEYPILNGDNTVIVIDDDNKVEDQNLSVRVDAAITTFQRVYLNGRLLDPKYYTVTEGSTIVTLNPGYVGSLPTGKYQLEIIFEAGYAQTNFEIKGENNVEDNKDSLETDDQTSVEENLLDRPQLDSQALQDQMAFLGKEEVVVENKDLEEDTPKSRVNNSQTSLIPTGDVTNHKLWASLCVVATMILVGFLIKKKRKL